jgi:hypothetical protein
MYVCCKLGRVLLISRVVCYMERRWKILQLFQHLVSGYVFRVNTHYVGIFVLCNLKSFVLYGLYMCNFVSGCI